METFDVCDSTVDWLPGEYIFGDDYCINDDYMDERWKPIPDIHGYYISDRGRVWSSTKDNFIYGTSNKSGHVDFSFKRDGKRVHRYLHRLVAESFIPNNHDYPIVRHLDDDPRHNEIDNLEWGDQSDNIQDAIRNGRFRFLSDDHREKAMVKRRMPVVCVNVETGEKHEFVSQQEASRRLGIEQSEISSVINNKRRTVKGYRFEKSIGEVLL